MKRKHPSINLSVYAIAALFLLAPTFSTSGSVKHSGHTRRGKIAFTARYGDEWFIYTMKPDGSRLTRLTNPIGAYDSDVDPSFSPNGSEIVFISWRKPTTSNTVNGLSNDIFVMKPNGISRTRLTQTSARYISPVFSADGRRIAFYSDEPNALYLMKRHGTGAPVLIWRSKLGSSPGMIQGHLAFSPDGRKIAFAAFSDYKGHHGREVGPISIYIINLDGTGLKRLTKTFTNDIDPCFSPDGRKIVFSSGNGLYGYTYVHMMNVDGTQRTVINPFPNAGLHGESEPYFSPNGRKIVFVAGDDEYREIYVMDSNGKHPKRLTRNKVADLGPVWGR